MSTLYAVLLVLLACALIVEIASALRRASRPLPVLKLRTDPMDLLDDRRTQDLAFVGKDRREAMAPAQVQVEERARRAA